MEGNSSIIFIFFIRQVDVNYSGQKGNTDNKEINLDLGLLEEFFKEDQD